MSMWRKEQQLSKLHFFIFGATIVGETVVSSLIVSEMGPEILPKLTFLNGVLLFLLPALLLTKIDKINRGELFKKTLKYAAIIVITVFFIYQFSSFIQSNAVRKLSLLILFPISYLLKTVLFLSFWSVATDISDAVEAKRIFPSVAAFGFMGSLSGAVVSRVLLTVVDAMYILLFWFVLYVIALYSMRSFVRLYRRQLIPLETLPTAGKKKFALLESVLLILKMPLVRNIANLYFAIFVTILLLDFFFWSICSAFYETPGKLASFQFTFICFHNVITILALKYYTPDHVNEKGFTRVFSYLPRSLFGGAIFFSAFYLISGGVFSQFLFIVLVVWQVLRQVIFENFFSPVYQMFFATMEPEIRGRAKTVIEGFVKPSAFVFAALIQFFFAGQNSLLLGSIVLAAGFMVFVSGKIKKVYIRSLVEGNEQMSTNSATVIPSLAARLGDSNVRAVLSYLDEFDEYSNDVKRLFVNLLVHMDKTEIEPLLLEIVRKESDHKIKSIIASHCGNFQSFVQKEIADIYIEDESEDIRIALLASLVQNLSLLHEYRDIVWARFVLAKSEREKYYSVLYISRKGKRGDKGWAKAYMKSLLVEGSTCRQKEYGLLGNLSFDSSYSDIVLDSIHSFSLDTLSDVLNILLQILSINDIEKLVGKFAYSDKESTKRLFLKKMLDMPPAKLTGISRFIIENRRNPINRKLINVMADIRSRYPKGNALFPDSELYGVKNYVQKECETVYLNCAVYSELKAVGTPHYKNVNGVMLIEDALNESLIQAAELIFDALVILEGLPYMIRARNEFSLRDSNDKSTLIELIELLPSSSLKDMMIPILEESDWETYKSVGQRFFTIKPNSVVYLTSNDDWLTVVGIYWHYLNYDKRPSLQPVVRQLNQLKGHKNSLIKQLAENLLCKWEGKEMDNSGFEVLDRVLFLKRSELFTSVPAHNLVKLAEIMQLIVYQKGDIISEEGNIANHLYLVKKGTVELKKDEIILNTIEVGKAYGEAGLFCDSVRTQSAIARNDCSIYVINKTSLKKLIAVTPSLAVAMLSVFGSRMQEKDEQILRLHGKMAE